MRRVDPGRSVGPAPGEVVIFYRRFTPSELAEAVSAGEVLPVGVIRFIVEECVLNLRYSLELLEKGEPAIRKAELRKFVRHF